MSVIEFLVYATCATILVVSLWFYPKYECGVKAEKQGLEYDWGIVQGCMVKEDGDWVDYERMRVMK